MDLTSSISVSTRHRNLGATCDRIRATETMLNDSIVFCYQQILGRRMPVKPFCALMTHTQRPITKEEVQAELTTKCAAGYGPQVRALLRRYGVGQISALNPGDYEAVLYEAQFIGEKVD